MCGTACHLLAAVAAQTQVQCPIARACSSERELWQPIDGVCKHECFGSKCHRTNRLEGSACRHTSRGRASLAEACIFARLSIIEKLHSYRNLPDEA